jgi:SAM-dependent methyltransferase
MTGTSADHDSDAPSDVSSLSLAVWRKAISVPTRPDLLRVVFGACLIITLGFVYGLLQGPTTGLWAAFSLSVACLAITTTILYFAIPRENPETYYLFRNEATSAMFRDMGRSRSLAFLGIANSHLAQYMKEVRDAARDSGRALPWEDIHVFVARDDMAADWVSSPRQFHDDIHGAVDSISMLLTDDVTLRVAPNVRTVKFYQSKLFQYSGGSYFGSGRPSSSAEDLNREWSVVYPVHYLPAVQVDARESLAARYERTRKSDHRHIAVMNKYTEALKFVHDHSTLLLSLDLADPWNESVDQWVKFERTFHIYEGITNELLRRIGLSPSAQVLEFGCGPGLLSGVVASHCKSGRLIAIDKSPQMVRCAKEHLKSSGASMATVGDARTPMFATRSFESRGIVKFDVVLVMFALHELLTGNVSVAELMALWTHEYLKTSGRVVVALHNGVVADLDKAPGFEGWTDPLRASLRELFALNYGDKVLREPPRPLSLAAITGQLVDAGFHVSVQQFQVSRSMEDRLAMWRVPAIMNTLVDIRQVPPELYSTVLDRVRDKVVGLETMPTTVALLQVSRGAPREGQPPGRRDPR